MRLLPIHTLTLVLTATLVLASPKKAKHAAHAAGSNTTATTTSTGSTAGESTTSGGWYYLQITGPGAPPQPYTGCSLANGDTGSEAQPAYVFNLSATTYPACTPQLDTALYPSVDVEPGDPGMALCETWIAAPDDPAVNGQVPLVKAYVDLCG